MNRRNDRPHRRPGRAGDGPSPEVAATPGHIAAALVDEVTAAAAAVLTGDELDAVTIRFFDGDDGPTVRVRGPEELVDRVERALYPDDAPDGQNRAGGPAAADGAATSVPPISAAAAGATIRSSP